MGRIIDAVKVLVNGQKKEVVSFGFSKAATIFEATKGRYSEDASKAVPFAIISTAQALGAKITIRDEGLENISLRQSDIRNTREHTDKRISSSEEKIASLLKMVESEKLSIANAKEAADRRITENEVAVKDTQAVLDFFTV